MPLVSWNAVWCQVESLKLIKYLSLNLHAYTWGNEGLQPEVPRASDYTRAGNCRSLFTTRPTAVSGAATLMDRSSLGSSQRMHT